MIRWCIALMMLAAGPALAAAPSPPVGDFDAVKARGELRIGADPTAGEPYYWLAAGKPKGFEAELGEAIAKKLGVKAVFVTTSWRDLLPALAGGRIDVALNALEVRPDGEAAFTTPYYVSSQAILVRSDQQRIYGLSDLAGKKVATTDGSVASAILGKLKPPAATRLFADTQAPFKDLAAGHSDAVLLESAMVRRRQQADPKKFRLAGLPLLPRPYAAAVRKRNPQLLASVNKAIGDLLNAGEIKKILTGYNLWDSLQSGGVAPAAPAATPTPSRHRAHRLGGR
ncbi:MAG: Amino acid transporter binding protein and permease protein [Cyanobacteria bacterium RYN_339]|nr:Amino acid transporter binding protein and permease protein [Cyanobacteria bacterium RYN_339]